MSLAYTRYMLNNWDYFLNIKTGNSNNLNFNINLSRTSTDNQLFPRRGSEFDLSLSITPPWSAFDNKDYKNLATNRESSNYNKESQEKYRLSIISGSSRARLIQLLQVVLSVSYS